MTDQPDPPATLRLPSAEGGRQAMARMNDQGTPVGKVSPQPDDLAPLLMEFESPSAALIARPVPAKSRYITWVITSMFAALLVIMSTIKVDRIVSATGKVVATANNVVVQPLETSIVRSINVREGQLVRKGDLLARLDPTFTAADAGALETSVASLQAEVDRLQAEVSGQEFRGNGGIPSQLQLQIFWQRRGEVAAKTEGYRQKIDSLQSKVEQTQGESLNLMDRYKLSLDLLQRRQEGERTGVTSSQSRLQAEDAAKEVEGRLKSTLKLIQVGQRDLAAAGSERDAYLQSVKNESAQQFTEQGRKLSEARESLTKARMRNSLVELHADRDAIVLSVAAVNVGSVMASGDQFITIVPVDSPLEVEAILDGRDAGYVGVGDPVTIKFETFAYTLFGTAEGVVRAVSPDSFRNPLADRSKGGRPQNQDEGPGAYFFRARISLDAIKLHDLPASFRMTPGMPVVADVKVGQRTIMAYIFARVIPIASEGMREP
ncbi:MAG: HlyD family type I secretion periplasmic adaptor subunit [Acetobacteraceae bacterium]|nr:HlyD family type I secretion periplasmic adaptor subunit [Acetobacteraceae bacterium]